MEGMRRTSDGHKATDGLARLSVNARGVSLTRSADSSPTGGAATAGGAGVPRGKAGSRATAAAGGGVVTASRVAQAEEDSEEVDERAVNAARSTAADAVAKAGREGAANVAATVRRGSSSTTRAVKSGMLAGQRRVAASAAVTFDPFAAAEAGITVGRANAAVARAAAAAAGFLRSVAAAVTALVSSAPVVAIVTAVLIALVAVISVIGWLIPTTESATKPAPITSGVGAVVGIGGWMSPVPAGTAVTSDYGPRPSICTSAGCTKPWHNGIDLPQGCGAAVMAAADGVVENAGPYGDFGNAVILDHVYNGIPMTTMYAHLQTGSIPIAVGQTVKAGTVIGHEGDTGKSVGCHLHIEFTQAGVNINPRTFLASVGITYP